MPSRNTFAWRRSRLARWGMRFPEDVPVLTDGEVTLRAHTPADIDDAIEMCSDPEFARWTTVPVPYQRKDAVYFLTEKIPAGWRDGGFWSWAIDYQGRFAGGIDLRGGEGGAGEVGFGLASWARGNEVMTRAVRLVVRHAFDGFGWDVVIWRAMVGNWASRRVAWKTGFRQLTTVRGGAVHRDVRRDQWVATIGKDDKLEPAHPWWSVPVLESERVRLRPAKESDAERIAEACSDQRTQKWLSAMPSPYTVTDALEYIESHARHAAGGTGTTWIVADPATDELLANVSVFELNNRLDPTSGEIGYWAHPDARGRGMMTEAIRLLVRHAFTAVADGGLGRRRLYLKAAAGNPASQQVARANGFTEVGVERAANRRRDGSYDDLVVFDLLVTDLPANGKLGPDARSRSLVESPRD